MVIIIIAVLFAYDKVITNTRYIDIISNAKEVFTVANYAELMRKTIDSNINFISLRAVYELGQKGGGFDAWTADSPTEDELKAELEKKIIGLDKLGIGKIEKKSIAWTGNMNAAVSWDESKLTVSGSKPFKIRNENKNPAVELEKSGKFEREVKTSYLNLTKNAKKILNKPEWANPKMDEKAFAKTYKDTFVGSAKEFETEFSNNIKTRTNDITTEFETETGLYLDISLSKISEMEVLVQNKSADLIEKAPTAGNWMMFVYQPTFTITDSASHAISETGIVPLQLIFKGEPYNISIPYNITPYAEASAWPPTWIREEDREYKSIEKKPEIVAKEEAPTEEQTETIQTDEELTPDEFYQKYKNRIGESCTPEEFKCFDTDNSEEPEIFGYIKGCGSNGKIQVSPDECHNTENAVWEGVCKENLPVLKVSECPGISKCEGGVCNGRIDTGIVYCCKISSEFKWESSCSQKVSISNCGITGITTCSVVCIESGVECTDGEYGGENPNCCMCMENP